MFKRLIQFIREQYATNEVISLHTPIFAGSERDYVIDTIQSTFVSSVGAYVDQFESAIATYTGSPKAVATVNGTAALHVALKLAGVAAGDLVLTQALTFVATSNAIAYCNAEPVFLDVDRATLGLSPQAVTAWLEQNASLDDSGVCRFRVDGRRIRACLPMHTFGHPANLDELLSVCHRWNLPLIEDAAEAMGSLYRGRHAGVWGLLGILSFNGNKIITTGGGGMILASEELATRAKHLTTTAKQPHAFEYVHDELGFNYRLPNINAALGCGQLAQLDRFINCKRELASRYAEFFSNSDLEFVKEPENCRSNYWLNAVICPDQQARDLLLQQTNAAGIATRPVWRLMHLLPMYQHCLRGPLSCCEWLSERIVNLPSSAPLPMLEKI